MTVFSVRSIISALLILQSSHMVDAEAAEAWVGGTPPPSSSQGQKGEDPAEIAAEIIGGMSLGFMNQKDLPDAERQCITQAAATVTKALVEAAEKSVGLLQKVFGGTPASGDFAERRLLPPGEEGGGTPSVVPELRTSLSSLVNLVTTLTTKCVKNDGLAQLKLMAHHLQDLKFMRGQVLANGADIAFELSIAIKAYRDKDFVLFGRNLGEAWRRVLLKTTAQKGGPPPPEALEQMTAGLVQGFFGRGFAVDLGIVQPGSNPPITTTSQISLHQCVAENVNFFRAAFVSITSVFQQMSLNDAATPEQTDAASSRIQSSMAGAMFGLPGAMERCGGDSAKKVSLSDALDAMKSGRVRLELPEKLESSTEEAEVDSSMDLAAAMRDWTHQEWTAFGYHLGVLLQRLVLLAFPEKYAIDSTGSLQNLAQDLAVPEPVNRLTGGMPVFGYAAFAMLVTATLVTVVAQRLNSAQRRRGFWASAWSGSAEEELEGEQACVEEGEAHAFE